MGIVAFGLGTPALITMGYGYSPIKLTIGKREIIIKIDFKKLEKLKKLLETFLLLLILGCLEDEVSSKEIEEVEIIKRAIELIDLIEKERATIEDLRRQLDLLQGEKNE